METTIRGIPPAKRPPKPLDPKDWYLFGRPALFMYIRDGDTADYIEHVVSVCELDYDNLKYQIGLALGIDYTKIRKVVMTRNFRKDVNKEIKEEDGTVVYKEPKFEVEYDK
jgi:hypothetical protein